MKSAMALVAVVFVMLSCMACSGGRAITEATPVLTLVVRQNPSFGRQTLVAGTSDNKIAEYIVMAYPSREDVSVSTVTITAGDAGAQFTNLRVVAGGRPFGSMQAVVNDSTAYTFAGAPFTAPKSQHLAAIVQVYADVRASAPPGTEMVATSFSGCSGRGEVSSFTAVCQTAAGQQVVIVKRLD